MQNVLLTEELPYYTTILPLILPWKVQIQFTKDVVHKNAFILHIFIILIPLKKQLQNNKHCGIYPTKATHMLRQNRIHKLN